MSRKSKRKSATKQRTKASAIKKPEPVETAPEPAAVPEIANEPGFKILERAAENSPSAARPFITRKAARHRPTHTVTQRYTAPKSLIMTAESDAGGDCWNYDVQFPAGMTIEKLLKAIRNDYPNDSAAIYISLSILTASVSNFDLGYEYQNGILTWTDQFAVKMRSRKNQPMLSDVLDTPVRSVKATGGWGAMTWYVNAYKDIPEFDSPENPEESE